MNTVVVVKRMDENPKTKKPAEIRSGARRANHGSGFLKQHKGEAI